MNGLAIAERIYDSRLPEDFAPECDESSLNEPFGETTVEMFIEDCAASDDAVMFFEDRGCHDVLAGAELIKSLCKAWVKDKAAVHALVGTEFWQEMKELALQAADYAARNNH